MKRNCLECGEALAGRTDKKFCGDTCRNSHNNRGYSQAQKQVRQVNGILMRNRRILESYLKQGRTRIRIVQLAGNGFNFAHFTGIQQTVKGRWITLCYEFGYMHAPGKEEILLARIEDVLSLS